MSTSAAMPISHGPAAPHSEWRPLVERLQRLARALVGSRRHDLADDLVQDALARLLARSPDAAPPPYPVARVTLTRLFLDHERGARRRAARAVRWAMLQPPAPARRAEGPDRDAVHRAIERLPPLQRAAIVLRLVEDLPTDAVAQALDTTPRAVRSALHTARARLRAALPSEGRESDP
jgi:RNA polymerase sigma factor (sigma-70 family)